MAPDEQWRRAFARQAASDLKMRAVLISEQAPQCQLLHYLQMACEKLVKAHLYGIRNVPVNLHGTHAVINKHLVRILESQYRLQRGRTMPGSMRRDLRHLTREIEVLAPSVDAGGARQDNCEYPWALADGLVRSPLDYQFPTINLLESPSGRVFLKLLPLAVQELL